LPASISTVHRNLRVPTIEYARLAWPGSNATSLILRLNGNLTLQNKRCTAARLDRQRDLIRQSPMSALVRLLESELRGAFATWAPDDPLFQAIHEQLNLGLEPAKIDLEVLRGAVPQPASPKRQSISARRTTRRPAMMMTEDTAPRLPIGTCFAM
jgi:hypothetical protein